MILGKPKRTLALAVAALAVLGGCRTVTGHVWLPVYSVDEAALGRVAIHFTADCVLAGQQEPLVRLEFIDTVQNVRFDGEMFAPLCAHYDSLEGVYGRFDGVYRPAEDWQGLGRVSPGRFIVEIIDGGEPGYSEGDYLCVSMHGGTFAKYKLPARDSFDDDFMADEGCSAIGGGRIQLNLDGTAANF